MVHGSRKLRRAATRAAVAITVAFVLLVPAPVAAGTASPIIFNARDDFRVSPNEANPSGPWSYRRTAPNGNKPLLPNFSTDVSNVCGPSGEGQQVWFGPEVLDLPAVWKNTTGSDAFPCGAFVPAGALMAHPGNEHAVVIRWTSPIAGSIHVRAALIDRDDFCGEGVNWAIRVLGQPPIAKGNIPNGGLAKVRAGWFHVEQGSRLELRVGRGPDHNGCDSTQVRLRIALSPDNI